MRTIAATVLTALLAMSSIGVAAGADSEVIWLDSYDPLSKPVNGEFDYTCQTSICPTAWGQMVLQPGRWYKLKVRGSWSPFPIAQWTDGYVGKPEPRPLFPSSGTQNGPVGFDSLFSFAHVSSWQPPAGLTPPFKWPLFEASVDGGATWADATPKRFKYSAKHQYQYEIQGAGQPLMVRIPDNGEDNYGMLRVEVRRIAATTN